MKNILAIDIGGSKLLCGIVDESGKILTKEKTLLPPTYNIDFLIKKIKAFAVAQAKYSPICVGVSVPGLADAQNGVWVYSPFSGISDIPIARLLNEQLGLPVFIENDVDACAIGEAVYGSCKTTRNFIWITVSNGIGSGIVLNGKLYRGAYGSAGEIGHFVIDDRSEAICGCKNKGCLEALASGRGIALAYKKLTDQAKTAAEIATLAKSGDATAITVFNNAAFYIGKAAAYCINILNLEKVIIGGGVSQSFELLEPSLNAAMERYLFKAANRNAVIEKTALGYYASLIGCSAAAKKGMTL